MQELWRRAEHGRALPYKSESWGRTIGSMRHLKSLVLEFEIAKDKESELKDVVALAQLWKFPLEFAYRSLQTGKRQPEWRYWRGPKYLNPPSRAREDEGPDLMVAKVFYHVVKTSTVELTMR